MTGDELRAYHTKTLMTPSDLRTFRASVGQSRSEFARALGVSPGAVRNWEQGAREVPEYIAAHLRCWQALRKTQASLGATAARAARGRF